MWILSQDKENLLNANCFYIDSYTYKDKTEYYIRASIFDLDNSIIVAEYSTEAKAKKILKALVSRIDIINSKNVALQGVYPMPNDEEVD